MKDEQEVALGIDFGGTKTAMAVGTGDGAILAQERIVHAADAHAEQIVTQAFLRAKGLIRPFNVSRVGISTMGLTRSDKVLLAPNVAGWAELHLPEMARACFEGKPLALGNDVKAAAQAECLWGNLAHRDGGAFLNWGTGIALAFTSGGRVQQGAHGASGEIAYAWQDGSSMGFAEGHAPFEEATGGGALRRAIAERLGISSMEEFFARLPHDGDCQRYWQEILEWVAQVVGVALLAVDAEVLVIGGGLVRQFSLIGPALSKRWQRYLPFPPEVIQSAFGSDGGMRGGLALAWSANLIP